MREHRKSPPVAPKVPPLVKGARAKMCIFASQALQDSLGIMRHPGMATSVRPGPPLRFSDALRALGAYLDCDIEPTLPIFDDGRLLVRWIRNAVFHGEDEPSSPRIQHIVVAFKADREPADACRELLIELARPEYAERRISLPGPDGVVVGPQVRRVLVTERAAPERGTLLFSTAEVRVRRMAFDVDGVEDTLCGLPELFERSTADTVHTDQFQPGPAPPRPVHVTDDSPRRPMPGLFFAKNKAFLTGGGAVGMIFRHRTHA